MPKICYKPERQLKYVAKTGDIEDIEYKISENFVEINYPISPLGVLVIVDWKVKKSGNCKTNVSQLKS